jgi:hypothetical protein
MGGSTAINQGIWILETPQWLIENVKKVAPDEDFFDEAMIQDAFQWVTEVRVVCTGLSTHFAPVVFSFSHITTYAY